MVLEVSRSKSGGHVVRVLAIGNDNIILNMSPGFHERVQELETYLEAQGKRSERKIQIKGDRAA